MRVWTSRQTPLPLILLLSLETLQNREQHGTWAASANSEATAVVTGQQCGEEDTTSKERERGLRGQERAYLSGGQTLEVPKENLRRLWK